MADYHKAEELRKAGRFQEAELLFAELWSQSRNVMHGWRYAYCMRKQSKFDEALDIGYEAVECFPDDQWAKNELIWAIYDARIKPTKEQDDLQAVLESANETIQLGASDLALKLIVFAVVDVAKARGKWDVVVEWCDRLDRTVLSADATQLGDHQMMSDRERWFFARVKAAGELKRWEEARTLGIEASQTFPRRKDFARWSAKAWAQLGHIDEAIVELKNLLKQGRPEWYLYHDLAIFEAKAGATADAMRHACEAALAHGEDKAKINLFSLMGRLWLQQGELLPAAQSLALTKQIREREGWSTPAQVQQLEADIKRAYEAAEESWPDLPVDPGRLARALRPVWQQGANSGLELKYGTIKRLPPDKDFGFIRPEDGSDDVYFKRREAPPACLKEGQRVVFVLEPAFDQVKQKEAFRAVKIRSA